MIDLIRERRSIRKYTDQKISEEIIEELKEVALRSPTSRNRKEWKFWFVANANQLEKLASAKAAGSKMIAQAPFAIIIGARESECDVWIEDTSIAAILLQMAAQSHGIGSVWVQIRKRFTAEGTHSEDRVKEILSINDPDIKIASIIALGYPDEIKEPIDHDDLHWDAIQQ